jgi:hypothetical protein
MLATMTGGGVDEASVSDPGSFVFDLEVGRHAGAIAMAQLAEAAAATKSSAPSWRARLNTRHRRRTRELRERMLKTRP